MSIREDERCSEFDSTIVESQHWNDGEDEYLHEIFACGCFHSQGDEYTPGFQDHWNWYSCKDCKKNVIILGCDHAGVNLKKAVMQYLDEKNIKYLDLGTDGKPCDYPDIAKQVAEKIVSGEARRGILICGTGVGMSIAANKVKGIRAAVCNDCFSTRYTRKHNDANILCMGERVIGTGLALELVEIFLETEFEGGRHERRVQKITELENK